MPGKEYNLCSSGVDIWIRSHGQSLKLLLGDLTLSIHGLCAKSFGFHIPDMLPGRPPAAVQSSILFKRGLSSLGMWHVLTFSRITIGLLRRRSDRPVIGGDLACAHVSPGTSTLCLKKRPSFKLSLTLSNLNRFSNFLHCWKAYEICYKSHMTIPTSP